MLCENVKSYLANSKGLPFFYVVGDEDYKEILSEFTQSGVIIDRVSDFCPKDDKYPDIDDIIDHFRTLDMDYRQNKHVLIGLGEYLALRGAEITEKVLRRLKNTTLGTARVIILLRCVTPQINNLATEDGRIAEQKRLLVGENAISSLNVTCVKYFAQDNVALGIKNLLHDMEDCCGGKKYVKSDLDFSNSLIPVTYIHTAFSAVKQVASNSELAENMGTEAQWDRFFQELSKSEGSLDALFLKYGYEDEYEEDIYEKCAGFEFKNWIFFVFLKQKCKHIQNTYLKYVVSHTNYYEDLKNNLLTAIVGISRIDPRYGTFYSERKKLIKDFPESEVAIFIRENSVDPKESIYRYTDNTKIEREAIITWIAQYGYIDVVETIYPALAQYLKDYAFDCGALSEFITQYFKEYRIQKVTNRINPEFLELVESNAKTLPYTHLETRDSAILRIKDKKNSFLYWIDALGVEFLPYITYLVKKKGLSMHTDITYVELPTITSINRGFYEKWPGTQKFKESHLDEIKHKLEGGYFYTPGQAPIHLVSELKVVENAIDFAATELAMHKCKSFIIASDHGASRLAVLHHQEEKYETDTKGEHSGRCCKEFPDADLPNAIRENGYFVFSDYGRFKNSRAANVEVHGGATLEEVVVPVIRLSLRKQDDVVIKLLNADAIYCERHSGTLIEFYISDVENKNNIALVIAGKRYVAVPFDSTHYSVTLNDIKRAKKNIVAEIYDGDNLIGSVKFDIKGKAATLNTDFDDLF